VLRDALALKYATWGHLGMSVALEDAFCTSDTSQMQRQCMQIINAASSSPTQIGKSN